MTKKRTKKYNAGYLAYEQGEQFDASKSKFWRKGWIDAMHHECER